MQITHEIMITFFCALLLGFFVTPLYLLAINRLNDLIDSSAPYRRTMLEFLKVGASAMNLLLVFGLPIWVMTKNISNNTLGENCISVHMATFSISSIISAIILYKTGNIKAIWRRRF